MTTFRQNFPRGGSVVRECITILDRQDSDRIQKCQLWYHDTAFGLLESWPQYCLTR
jgi:hypothetical protein